MIYYNLISVVDVVNLLVFNKQNELTLAIDLNVYSKNQQFRLFDCIKRGQLNPLVQSNYFPFNNQTNLLYRDIIKKSIITDIEENNIPTIYIKNNQFLCQSIDQTILPKIVDNNINIIHLSIHWNSFCFFETKSVFNSSVPTLKVNSEKKEILNDKDDQVKKFIPFIENLIKEDKTHQGYIQSCVHGITNKDMLFFNIGGDYKYCDKKKNHHKRNSTAILINTRMLKYAIRCKDANCDNRILDWKKIQ